MPAAHPDNYYVCREALIEGPIDINDFFNSRAEYISEIHGVSTNGYHELSTCQFNKIKSIPDNADINLWFEDDLFCQCNLWFIIDLLLSRSLKANIYLVRPTSDSWLGFGSMEEKLFAQAYKNRTLLTTENLSDFQKLWFIYSQQIKDDPKEVAEKLITLIPRLPLVIEAHLERLEPLNRPLETLKKIMSEMENHDFPSVFKEFCIREGIYGFGDTSIKKMYDNLLQQNK